MRRGDERVIKVKEGEATGRHVVLVDDMIQSGGTLIECAKVSTAFVATLHPLSMAGHFHHFDETILITAVNG